MFVGKDRLGKISLKRFLKGDCFDLLELSIVGIEVDFLYF